MKEVVLTRQAVSTRIVELFDLLGCWEPIKLQLKLHLSKLNGKDLKEPLSPEEHVFLKRLLVELVDKI